MWHKRNECRQNPFCCCAESVVAFDANAVGDGFKQICMDTPKKKDRIIKTEEKAKVVACVWGEECIQDLATLAVLPHNILIIGTRMI